MLRIVLICMALGIAQSHAQPKESSADKEPRAQIPTIVQDTLPNVELVGSSPYHYLFWYVYDAAFYAPNGQYDPAGSYALVLNYKRDLSGKSIAERSTKLMREMGCGEDEYRLAGWHSQMKKIFPDVRDGSTLIGIRQANGEAWFYDDKTKVGEVKDPMFADCFFHIWLGERTTEPALRAALLGL